MTSKQRLFIASASIFILLQLPLISTDYTYAVEDAHGPVDSKEQDSINILAGEIATVTVHSLTRLSITDPSIADVTSATEEEMIIIGKRVGQTIFFIWDEFGKRTFIVRVYGQELVSTQKRVESLLKKAEIEGLTLEINPMEGKIVITGKVLEKDNKAYKEIVGQFSDSVLDFTEGVPMEDLIQIDMQVAEINTTLQKSLGIDWTTDDNSSLIFTFPETLPTSPNNAFDRLLEIGEFNRTSTLLATVNALLQEGKGRVLSKPKLVVKSGHEASFQVGGQVPIRTTTTSTSGTSTENVSFRDYGILMSITPTIKENKINVSLSTEISEIDASNSTDQDVAFTTRTATTTLLLDDQQTIVLAGLIKRSTSATIKKVPFLGDIPIIGMAFRSRSQATPDLETEVVISLKPTIIRQKYVDGTQAANLDRNALMKGEYKGELMEMIGADKEDFSSGAEPAFADAEQSGSMAAADNEFLLEEAELELLEPATAAASRGDEAMAETGENIMESVADELEPAPMDDMSEPDMAVNTEPLSTSVSEMMAKYVQSVQEKISKAISYPYEAAENGWEGTVKLTLKILRDGTLDDVSVKQSSGHDVFDTDAVNTTQILAPFESFPPDLDLEEIIVTIPIVYSQGEVSVDMAACETGESQNDAEVADNKFLAFDGRTYAQAVQERIAKSAIYPEEAKKYGWEGTVKLNLHILRDGSLDYALVKESSGYEIFDQCALQTAKTTAPYSVFPSDSELHELDVTVPIIYSLNTP